MAKFIENARELPVLYDGYDIAVAGGGIAGAAAALAAARAGRHVLLIDRLYLSGGLATAGLVTIYLPLCDGMGHQLSYGIAEEFLRLSISHGWEADYPDTWLEAGRPHDGQRFQVRFNAQVFAILLEQLLAEAGVDILYGTVICGTILNGNRLEALIVENKDGRSAVPVQAAVDATGDADLFSLSSKETVLHGSGNKLASWYYETIDGRNRLHMLGASDVLPENENGSVSEMPEQLPVERISGLDAKETSEWMIQGHELCLDRFLKDGDVSETHSLSAVATTPQLRMTRRMQGRYTLDAGEDHVHFEDSIGMVGDWRISGPAYEIPMRVLCSDELMNVTAAGRCISVTDDMWDITRVIPAAAVTGQAAGTMLALSGDTSKLSYDDLQRELRRQGAKLYLDEVL